MTFKTKRLPKADRPGCTVQPQSQKHLGSGYKPRTCTAPPRYCGAFKIIASGACWTSSKPGFVRFFLACLSGCRGRTQQARWLCWQAPLCGRPGQGAAHAGPWQHNPPHSLKPHSLKPQSVGGRRIHSAGGGSIGTQPGSERAVACVKALPGQGRKNLRPSG